MSAPLILNEERHESIWTLSHSALVQSNVFKVTYNSIGQVMSLTTYDPTQTHILRLVTFTYNANGTVATIVKQQYDDNTYALTQTMTGNLTYMGSNVSSITWTRT